MNPTTHSEFLKKILMNKVPIVVEVKDYDRWYSTVKATLSKELPEFQIILMKHSHRDNSTDIYKKMLVVCNCLATHSHKTITVFLGKHWNHLLVALKIAKMERINGETYIPVHDINLLVVDPSKRLRAVVKESSYDVTRKALDTIREIFHEDTMCVCCLETPNDRNDCNQEEPAKKEMRMSKCVICNTLLCKQCIYDTKVNKTNECIVCKQHFFGAL